MGNFDSIRSKVHLILNTHDSSLLGRKVILWGNRIWKGIDMRRVIISALGKDVLLVDDDTSIQGRVVCGYPVCSPQAVLSISEEIAIIVLQKKSDVLLDIVSATKYRQGNNLFFWDDLETEAQGRGETKHEMEFVKPQPAGINDVDYFMKKSLVDPVFDDVKGLQNQRFPVFMENIADYLSGKLLSETEICTVIIACNRFRELLQKTVRSVLLQSYHNIEVLLILDENSKVETKRCLQELLGEGDTRKKIRFLYCRGDLTYASMINRGLDEAKGDFIFYLKPGDTWEKRYLAVMMGAFCCLPKAEAIYAGICLHRGTEKKPYSFQYAAYNKALLQNRNYIELSAFAHRKRIINKIGKFNHKLVCYPEYDYVLKVSEKCSMYSVPVMMANHNTSVWNEKNFDENRRIYELTLIHKAIEENKTEMPVKLPVKVSAIIPNYELFDQLNQCVNSLSNAGIDEIIIVDNASSMVVRQQLQTLVGEYGCDITIVQNEHNMGFTFAVNQGIERARKTNDILLANNDSIYEPSSIKFLQETAYAMEDCGFAVPQQIRMPKDKFVKPRVPYADEDYPCDVNIGFNIMNVEHVDVFCDGKLFELNFAPFFSVYIKREIYDALGPLDAWHCRHYNSDRSYCSMLRYMLGKKIYYVSSSRVHHKHQGSTKCLKDNDTGTYERMFVQNEWSDEERRTLGYERSTWENVAKENFWL